jgi:hypothetical protein
VHFPPDPVIHLDESSSDDSQLEFMKEERRKIIEELKKPITLKK